MRSDRSFLHPEVSVGAGLSLASGLVIFIWIGTRVPPDGKLLNIVQGHQ